MKKLVSLLTAAAIALAMLLPLNIVGYADTYGESGSASFTLSGNACLLVELQNDIVNVSLVGLDAGDEYWVSIKGVMSGRSQDLITEKDFSAALDASMLGTGGDFFTAGTDMPTDGETFTVSCYKALGGGSYSGIFWDVELLRYSYNKLVFLKSTTISTLNDGIAAYYPTDNAFLDEYYKRQPIDKTVAAKAISITENAADELQKMQLIHDWVAENIYYDLDYFYGKSDETVTDAAGVLECKKTIHEGYANLTNMMLRAVGVRSIVVSGYATGLGTSGKFDGDLSDYQSNHSWNMVLVGKTWYPIDVTWDCKNTYEDGEFKTGEKRNSYFFASSIVFAKSHYLMSDAGEVFNLSNYAIIGNDETVSPTAADFYIPSVLEAYAIQGGKFKIPLNKYAKYAKNITYSVENGDATKVTKKGTVTLGKTDKTAEIKVSYTLFGNEYSNYITLTANSRKSIDLCDIELSGYEWKYNGEERRPMVTVSDRGTVLTKNKDYTVTFKNNINAGTARVLIKGVGDYRGTVKVYYVIAK